MPQSAERNGSYTPQWLVGFRLDTQEFQLLRTMVRIATICLGLYWIAIFVATHLPASALPNVGTSDKLSHILAFAGLAFLLAWALPNGTRRRHALHVCLAGMSYAMLDELSQSLIPGRSCEAMDFFADCAGIGLGIIAYTICRQLLLMYPLGRRMIALLSR